MTENNEMNDYRAMMIVDGIEEARDGEEYLAAWQHLIDTGLAWALNGWFGRNAEQMINWGLCTA